MRAALLILALSACAPAPVAPDAPRAVYHDSHGWTHDCGEGDCSGLADWCRSRGGRADECVKTERLCAQECRP